MWPTEQANRVQFVTPNELLLQKTTRSAVSSPTQHCFFRYNKDDRLLSIVADNDNNNENGDDDNEEVILDVIDMDDMIGAKLEIQLIDSNDNNDGNTAASATAEASTSSNNNNDRADNEPPTDQLIDRQGCAVLKLFTYPRKDPSTSSLWQTMTCHRSTPKPNPHYQRPTDPYSTHSNRFAYIRTFVVTPQEDLQNVQTLTAALHQLATGRNLTTQSPPPTYLVLVNPCSGPNQNAERTANNIVVPMLEQAGIQTELVVTTHAGHATELLLQQQQNDSLSSGHCYDGLVLLGGDGIIHEALNGMFAARPNNDSQTTGVLSSKKQLKVGIVGCGTSNGLATSITFHSAEQYGVVDETYLIAKGHTMPIDLSQYETTTKSYIGFMTLSWAMIADVSCCIRVV